MFCKTVFLLLFGVSLFELKLLFILKYVRIFVILLFLFFVFLLIFLFYFLYNIPSIEFFKQLVFLIFMV